METSEFFPIYVKLVRRSCLVVGGGTVATHKVGQLLAAQAHVTVVSPEVTESLRDKAHRGQLTWKARRFSDDDLSGHYLVIAATDDVALNRHVFQLAEGRNMPANCVDDPDFCNFIFAAVADAGLVRVAVSSSGASPVLAQRLRNKITDLLIEDRIEDLAEFLGRWRARLGEVFPDFGAKRVFWNRVMDGPVPELIKGNQLAAAEQLMEREEAILHEQAHLVSQD